MAGGRGRLRDRRGRRKLEFLFTKQRRTNERERERSTTTTDTGGRSNSPLLAVYAGSCWSLSSSARGSLRGGDFSASNLRVQKLTKPPSPCSLAQSMKSEPPASTESFPLWACRTLLATTRAPPGPMNSNNNSTVRSNGPEERVRRLALFVQAPHFIGIVVDVSKLDVHGPGSSLGPLKRLEASARSTFSHLPK